MDAEGSPAWCMGSDHTEGVGDWTCEAAWDLNDFATWDRSEPTNDNLSANPSPSAEVMVGVTEVVVVAVDDVLCRGGISVSSDT
jgi:hypothetical protein